MPVSSNPSADSSKGGCSYFTLFLALMTCGMGAGFLLIIPAGFIGQVIVFGGIIFFGIVGLHYLIWGRWISRILEEEQAEEAANKDAL